MLRGCLGECFLKVHCLFTCMLMDCQFSHSEEANEDEDLSSQPSQGVNGTR